VSPLHALAYGPLVLLGGLVACQSATPPMAPTFAPAVLLQPSPESFEALRSTVARLLNVPAVTLAPDALQHTSRMVIEKARPRGMDGLPLTGRDFDQPEAFQLVTDGALCILVRLRTDTREALHTSQCARAVP
jgi:hypothetical protein